MFDYVHFLDLVSVKTGITVNSVQLAVQLLVKSLHEQAAVCQIVPTGQPG